MWPQRATVLGGRNNAQVGTQVAHDRKRQAERARKAARRRSAREATQRERRAEEHAKLVAVRQGDHRYTQREAVPGEGDRITLSPGLVQDLGAQREAFVQKFGREPEPQDPLFFDPAADEPTPWSGPSEEELVRTFREAGVPVSFAYAYLELGYLVTEKNRHLFSLEELDAFSEAVERHER